MGPRLRKLSAMPTDKYRTGWVILRQGDADIIALVVGEGGVEWEPQAARAPVFDGRITIEATDALATVEWA